MNREPTHQRFFMSWPNASAAAPRPMRPNIKIPRLRCDHGDNFMARHGGNPCAVLHAKWCLNRCDTWGTVTRLRGAQQGHAAREPEPTTQAHAKKVRNLRIP